MGKVLRRRQADDGRWRSVWCPGGRSPERDAQATAPLASAMSVRPTLLTPTMRLTAPPSSPALIGSADRGHPPTPLVGFDEPAREVGFAMPCEAPANHLATSRKRPRPERTPLANGGGAAAS